MVEFLQSGETTQWTERNKVPDGNDRRIIKMMLLKGITECFNRMTYHYNKQAMLSLDSWNVKLKKVIIPLKLAAVLACLSEVVLTLHLSHFYLQKVAFDMLMKEFVAKLTSLLLNFPGTYVDDAKQRNS